MNAESPLAACIRHGVSIIVPGFNHASYLGEAVESAKQQSQPALEIIIVDDGSSDETPVVAASFPGVRYIRQPNAGLAAARNTGWRNSCGKYTIFLDADDRLLPGAVAAGTASLGARSECAFVYGRFQLIDRTGQPLPTTHRPCIRDDAYAALLRSNQIGMHATVTYRRSALAAVGGFDPAYRACEDYELYLRLTSRYPIYCHDTMVAEYRQHSGNMSADAAKMLIWSLRTLQAQRKHVGSDVRLRAALRDGVALYRNYYGSMVVERLLEQERYGQWSAAARNVAVLARYHPEALRHHVQTKTAGALRRFAQAVGLRRGAGEASDSQEGR